MPTGAAAEQAAQKKTSSNGEKHEDKGPGSLAGNLTRDPELRYTNSGRPVTNLGVAYSERVRDPKTDTWQDGPVTFYEIQAWGNLAENCTEFLNKGDRIVAEGRWTAQTWTDKEGQEQEKIVLTARDLGPSMMFRGARPEPRRGKGDSQ